MNIIPKPQKIELTGEAFLFEGFNITSDDDRILRFAKGGGKTPVHFCLNKALGKEEYKIDATGAEIAVEYGDLEAAYRAHTTLKQLSAQSGKINHFHICDYPSIKNRGYMLDISRGKLPKLSYLKELVDILSDLKYNQLQLYMDKFIYEYKNFSKYCIAGNYLTKAEIAELSEYCRERFIELVPNQNGFGHMDAWLKKSEFSHLAITGKDGKPSPTLNPLLPESIELIDKIYDGMLDEFESDKANIGLDEPFELGLNETKEICDTEGIGKVYTDYLNKICMLVSVKYKKTPMFWDDIVFKYPEQLKNIPRNAIVMEWGYETEQHFDRNCQRLNAHGMRFYVCPGTSMWNSYTGRTNNAITNISKAAETGNYYGAEGFLLTEWGDGGHPQFPATTYFPLVFGGAVSWNCGGHNVEASYNTRDELICGCKEYLDKFIFKSSKEVSLADIAIRMGNYYLLEDCLHFNGTELAAYADIKDIPEQKVRAFKRVLNYMKDIKDELSRASADAIMLRELKLNCEMVIALAKHYTGESVDIKEMLSEYEALRKIKNYDNGTEIFIENIKKIFQNFTNC